MPKKSELRFQLLEVQRQLRERGVAVQVLVAGIEGAGRHAVLNALTHAFDTRGLRVHAWTPEAAPGQDRPPLWRHWMHLAPRGQIALFLEGWYDTALAAALRGETASLHAARSLEAQLRADGGRVLRLWVDLPLAVARQRLRARLKAEARAPLTTEQAVLMAPDEAEAALKTLRDGLSGVRVLDGARPQKLEKAALRAVLDALQEPAEPPPKPPRLPQRRGPSRLDAVSPAAPPPVDTPALEDELATLQAELARRAWAAHAEGRASVVVLEGADAAGKGGVIRRITQALDARLFRVIPIAAPNDEERARPYLWRFWRQLPARGQLTIFDRSWYGRVLVERVEGFAAPADWRRAYGEINDFEAQLVEAGIRLHKVWLQIHPDTQLARFQARADTPHKQHKLTDEDWRNREKWDLYQAAVEDLLARTDTPQAPWQVVAADHKPQARVEVLQRLIEVLG
jgi:AMP-polyphosphate phosphotransferase